MRLPRGTALGLREHDFIDHFWLPADGLAVELAARIGERDGQAEVDSGLSGRFVGFDRAPQFVAAVDQRGAQRQPAGWCGSNTTDPPCVLGTVDLLLHPAADFVNGLGTQPPDIVMNENPKTFGNQLLSLSNLALADAIAEKKLINEAPTTTYSKPFPTSTEPLS
ncbi:MAG TPA: hypothetical protein VFZ85_10490 [Jiangellaceae bacterium]